jgi:hypothetical protein
MRVPAKPLHNLYFAMAMLLFGTVVLPLLLDQEVQFGWGGALGVMIYVAHQLREEDRR